MSEIVIFEDDVQSVKVRHEGETPWLRLQQIEAVVAKDATSAADDKMYGKAYFILNEHRLAHGIVMKSDQFIEQAKAATSKDFLVVLQEWRPEAEAQIRRICPGVAV